MDAGACKRKFALPAMSGLVRLPGRESRSVPTGRNGWQLEEICRGGSTSAIASKCSDSIVAFAPIPVKGSWHGMTPSKWG